MYRFTRESRFQESERKGSNLQSCYQQVSRLKPFQGWWLTNYLIVHVCQFHHVPKCTISSKVRPTSALPDRCVFRFLTRLVFWLPTGGGFVLLFVLTDSTGEHLSRFQHRSNSFQETVPTWFNVGRYHGIGRVGIEPTSRTLIWDPAALHPIELPSVIVLRSHDSPHIHF